MLTELSMVRIADQAYKWNLILKLLLTGLNKLIFTWYWFTGVKASDGTWIKLIIMDKIYTLLEDNPKS